MRNDNPFGKPSERLGKQYKLDEFKGPMKCPDCSGTKFTERPFMEIWVLAVKPEEAQVQKRFTEVVCQACNCQVNLMGQKVVK